MDFEPPYHNNAFKSSSVLASSTGLSLRQRAIRRKPQGDARLVARTFLDAFEGDFEDVLGRDLPDGAEALEGVLAHPGGDLAELGVRQAGIGLGEGHQSSPCQTAKVKSVKRLARRPWPGWA